MEPPYTIVTPYLLCLLQQIVESRFDEYGAQLRCPATHCSTLQPTATHCNTLQHTRQEHAGGAEVTPCLIATH